MIFPLPAPPIPRFTCWRIHTGYIHIKRRFGPKNLQESLFFSQRRSAEKHRPPPSISPSQTTFAAIYPQNSACFSPPLAPILTPCPPFPVCRRKRPLIFHITELARFCGHLTSKIGTFFGSPAPHCLFRPSPPSACGTKTSPSYSISPRWSTFTLIYPQNSILFSGG